jgi:hypothetical protein
MDRTASRTRIGASLDFANNMALPTSAPKFIEWKFTTESVLAKSLGEDHRITQEFRGLWWDPPSYSDSSEARLRAEFFERAKPQAIGLLLASLAELSMLEDAEGIAIDTGFDPELWAFVAADVAAESWGKVITQAGVFTEDRIRRWAGRPSAETGVDLMAAVFGPQGAFRLGVVPAEQDGWHLLARGSTMALRNPGAHRISDRSDHKTYAMGVLGSFSVLLTQMRFDHENQFVDPAPIVALHEAP